MAFVPISVGSKYKGVLNMFGSQYDYIICFTEVDDENKTFMYNHKLLMGNYVADDKSGSGNFTIDFDSMIVDIIYTDPETKFSGKINVENQTLEGETEQINGLYNGTKGTFKLNIDFE